MTIQAYPADQRRVVRLHMEGPPALGGDVRLGAFIDKLAALKAAHADCNEVRLTVVVRRE